MMKRKNIMVFHAFQFTLLAVRTMDKHPLETKIFKCDSHDPGILLLEIIAKNNSVEPKAVFMKILVMFSYYYCKKLQQILWLKATQIYYLTVLGDKEVLNPGVITAVFLLVPLSVNLCPWHFQLLESSCLIGLIAPSSIFKALHWNLWFHCHISFYDSDLSFIPLTKTLVTALELPDNPE